TVNVQRLLDIYAIMERLQREGARGFALCTVAAEFTAFDGAGIALISDDDALTSLCTSDVASRALMELELALGEGPMVEASRGDASEDTDLRLTTSSEWAVYRTEAVALGARAVFAYPIRLGAIRFGALSFYRTSPGPLDAQQSSDAYLMASVIGRAILAKQAGGSLVGLAEELDGESTLDFRVHQAAGMLAVQGTLSVKDALILLRAHAFGVGRELSDLAERVVTGKTYFDSNTGEWIDDKAKERDER
ncbi:MAG: GAF and ANTAR domain-containing protein, partial [Acidimicrobiales bacterium]